jgi:hypothetical protein
MAQGIPFIGAAISAVSSLMDTAQQREVAKAQENMLKGEASVARRQAGMQEEALRRDTQRQFGELRAAGAQAGLLQSVSFADVYKQAATAAELDALSTAYQGETEAQSLLTEAAITRASRPSWTQGILRAASATVGGYQSAGGTLPTPKPRTPKPAAPAPTQRKPMIGPR